MDQKNKQYNEILKRFIEENKKIQEDKDFIRIKNIYAYKDPLIMGQLGANIAKRVETYPELTYHFTSKDSRRGKWDFKPTAKDTLDSHYLKDSRDTVFGFEFPGYEDVILDHDILGNILYADTLRRIGMPDIENKVAAWLDDLRQAVKNKGKKGIDFYDRNVISEYLKYLNKNPNLPTEESITFFLKEQLDAGNLRTYRKTDLTPRSVRAKEGEKIEDVSKRTGVPVSEYVKMLEKESKFSPIYRGIDENTSMKEDQKLNMPRREDLKSELDIKPQATPTSQKSEEVKSKSEDLFKQLQENNNPHEDILLKKYADVTEDELKETMKYSGYETQDKVLRNKLDDFVQKTYDYHYGSDPAKLDATGRMIESGVRVPFAKESKLLSTKDNIPMDEAFRKIAEQTSPFGVKSLQKGLNNLSLAESNSTPLKEDNVLGPKTTSRVKEILANHSLDEVNKNIKVGNFSSMLEENRSKMIDNDTLKNTMTTLRPQDGGLFLQKSINHTGADKPDFERLKEDNEIGEKTTTAFNQLKEENEDKLTAFANENMETEFEKTKEMKEREKQEQAEEEQAEREKEAEEKKQEEEEKEREEQEKIENAQSSLTTSNSLLK